MMSIYPWITLVAIVWLQAVNGTNTTFPAYSEALKSCLGISQINLNNLSVASDIGKIFGWCSGLALSYCPLWLVLITGATIGVFGYGMQFLLLVGKISTLEYWQAFLLCMTAGNSICWINTVCYVAAMQKFPAERGMVVSLATSYSGISAKVYIAMAEIIHGKTSLKNKSIYLLLNSIVPFIVAVIVLPFLCDSKSVVGDEKRVGLSSMFFLAGLTGTYAILTAIMPAFITIPQRMPMAILLGMILSTFIIPLLMKVHSNIMSNDKIAYPLTLEETIKRTMEVEAKEEQREGREYGFWDLVRSVEFWVYFVVYGCEGTLGLVYANNLGQIAESRGVSEAVLVSISSSFGFFGKLGSAPLAVLASNGKCAVSRIASLALLMVPMSISFFLLLNPSKLFLFAATAIIGMSNGAITSLAVSITSELFGLKHFAINHNILVANIPMGSFLFGYMAARIYDEKSDIDNHKMCTGVRCFHKTFLIWGTICALGTMLSFALYYRTRRDIRGLNQPDR